MASGGGETTVRAFVLCERCNEKLPLKYRSQHNCSLDAKIGMNDADIFLFRNEFRESYEYNNPYLNVKNVARLGGEKWKSFTEDEKEVYRDEAYELMEEYNESLESNDTDDEEEDEEEIEVEYKEDAPNGGQTWKK